MGPALLFAPPVVLSSPEPPGSTPEWKLDTWVKTSLVYDSLSLLVKNSILMIVNSAGVPFLPSFFQINYNVNPNASITLTIFLKINREAVDCSKKK